MIHHCIYDPYSIYGIILTPTRELAKQIHQQIIALGTSYKISSVLLIGGMNEVQQLNTLNTIQPHFVVATPGRLGELLRCSSNSGDNNNISSSIRIQYVRYIVFDEADRLLAYQSGFEKDIAELLLHVNNNSSNTRKNPCQKLFFSATMSKSLETLEFMLNQNNNNNESHSSSTTLPKLKTFMIGQDNEDNSNNISTKIDTEIEEGMGDDIEEEVDEDDIDDKKKQSSSLSKNDTTIVVKKVQTPKIPAGLKQEYVFMPSRVRDAYLLTIIRTFVINGGRLINKNKSNHNNNKKNHRNNKRNNKDEDNDNDNDENNKDKARSAIIFVSTCERAAIVSGMLEQVGVDNVALHSLLSQNRRLASLHKFQSLHVRIMVATDIASRGLDIPTVDLIINSELPRHCINYIHRVGRTARAGRRGHAISLVCEHDISLVQKCEELSGRSFEKCTSITDEMAISLLGPTTKALRLTKMKLLEIGFDELIQKQKLRKVRDNKDRQRIEKKLVLNTK